MFIKKGKIMVEAVSTPKQFNAIQYKTKDGETITATKKDGVVTLVGDKKGVRQMDLEDFKKELIANLPANTLEKTPAKDSVEISKNKAPEAPAEKAPAEKAPAEAKEAPKDAKVADADKKEDKAPVAEAKTDKEAPKAEVGKKIDIAA